MQYLSKTRLSLCLIILLNCSLSAQAAKPSPTVADSEKFKTMMSLPYLQGYFKAPQKTNVTLYNRELAYKGNSLYSSGESAIAYLIDMKGHVLHQWSYDLHKIWPNQSLNETSPFWENVYLYPNGDLLAIYHNGGVIKIDKDSKLLWSYDCNAHHDLTVDNQGRIYTLTNDWVKLKKNVHITDNSILILSPEGKFLKKISFLQMMHKSKNTHIEPLLKRVVGMALNGMHDVYHTNTLKVFNGQSSSRQPAIFKKGNILISMLTLSTIAIIDPDLEDIVWVGGPRLWSEGQHNVQLLENGHMLTFDNHYQGTKQSRILEFNPFERISIWEYTDKDFYSDTHGSQERLPNGNTLIIEANKGRAFEITRDKKIVWEFLNPNKTGKDNDLIATIFVMYRFDSSYTSSWLKSQ
ncbi:MAG: hypothetical protein H6754_05980 [Candidatus Omnitrophica bacterium]|nr:hypothetical protein [Candidatus Omnitrophota bacterium]